MARLLSRLGLALGVLLAIVSSGCGTPTRVVLVPPIKYIDGVPTDLVMLGPDPLRVYVLSGEPPTWTLSQNRLNLEGWYAAPPEAHKER